jgi:hypothetical protein
MMQLFALSDCVKLTAVSLSIRVVWMCGHVKLIVKQAATRGVRMNSANEMMHRFNVVSRVAIHRVSSTGVVSGKPTGNRM